MICVEQCHDFLIENIDFAIFNNQHFILFKLQGSVNVGILHFYSWYLHNKVTCMIKGNDKNVCIFL